MEQDMERKRQAQQEAWEAQQAEAENQIADELPSENGMGTDEVSGDEVASRPGAAPPPQVQVMPLFPDFGKIFSAFSHPWLIAHGIVDAATGLVLNIVMIVAGIGLLRLRRWGRKLALWTAALKIGRLVVVQGVALFVTVPIIAESMGNAVEGMIPQGSGPGPPPGTFHTVYGVMFSVQSLAFVLFGSIYPAICLWLLRKPAVKAACDGP
jgi:hypothetical protein